MIEQILKSYNILKLEKEFTDKISWTLIMDAREALNALSEITDKTSGRVNFKLDDDI